MKKKIEPKKFEKKEIIYDAIIEKELLHNGLVQREQVKTLKELNSTIKDLTIIIKELQEHQFLEIHRSKWKIVLYNLSLGILFAIGTVMGLLILSWSSYHFFKDSQVLKDIINSQLNSRKINISDIKEKVKLELSKENKQIQIENSGSKK